jgi:hypothetical protein
VGERELLYSGNFKKFFRQALTTTAISPQREAEFFGDFYTTSLTYRPEDEVALRRQLFVYSQIMEVLLEDGVEITTSTIRNKGRKMGYLLSKREIGDYDDIETIMDNCLTLSDCRIAVKSKFHKPQIDTNNRTVCSLNYNLLRMINIRYLITPYKIDCLSEIASDLSVSQAIPFRDPNRIFPAINKWTRGHSDLVGSQLFIYELKEAFDRAFLVHKVERLESDRLILDALSAGSIKELSQKVYLIDDLDNKLNDVIQNDNDFEQPENVAVSFYSPDRIVLSGSTTKEAFLVVTNIYHPDWKATLNGQENEILRANYTFQAVRIEKPGKFEVTLQNDGPENFLRLTIPISIFGVIFLFLGLLRFQRSS